MKAATNKINNFNINFIRIKLQVTSNYEKYCYEATKLRNSSYHIIFSKPPSVGLVPLNWKKNCGGLNYLTGHTFLHHSLKNYSHTDFLENSMSHWHHTMHYQPELDDPYPVDVRPPLTYLEDPFLNNGDVDRQVFIVRTISPI